jgi:NADH dehydrogenase
MSSVHDIAILGGTGFIGTRLAAEFTATGHRLRILTRRRSRGQHLLVLPTATVVETDIANPGSLDAALAGCDTIVNLVGILNERGDDGRGFEAAHVGTSESLVQSMHRLGIVRLLHMSALNAGIDAPSHYLRSKGRAEALVHAEGRLQVTSFRPSVVFGAGDQFCNRFARLAALTPMVFPLACAAARFAPVYVGDVARAFAAALVRPASIGRRYDLCGPRAYTLGDLVAYAAAVSGHPRRILALPASLSRLQAEICEHLPGKPFSRDNLRSLQIDSVGSTDGLQALGIQPTALEAIVPEYLRPMTPGGRNGPLLRVARRMPMSRTGS